MALVAAGGSVFFLRARGLAEDTPVPPTFETPSVAAAPTDTSKVEDAAPSTSEPQWSFEHRLDAGLAADDQQTTTWKQTNPEATPDWLAKAVSGPAPTPEEKSMWSDFDLSPAAAPGIGVPITHPEGPRVATPDFLNLPGGRLGSSDLLGEPAQFPMGPPEPAPATTPPDSHK